MNALATIAVADELRVDHDQVRSALRSFEGVQRRFSIVGEQAGVTVIDGELQGGWRLASGKRITEDEIRYQIINIKLDKTGGLTEALDLAKLATSRGKDLMIGNMVGTSLGMAPGYVIAQLCRFVDLDGTLYLTGDREHPITFDQGYMSRPESLLWG